MKKNVYRILKNILRKYRRNTSIGNIDYENAKMILKNDKKAVLVDVRSPQEYREGHLDGSINIPLYNIEQNTNDKIPDKECVVIVYCQSGARSKKATNILKQKGYTNLYNIEGGLDAM